MDWKAEIEAAAQRIVGHVRVTPVMRATLPGTPELELKFEHCQHTGSFKPRGAFNSLLSGPVPEAGVVAASGGNHGAAVAYAAKSLGVPAHIFVPEIAGPAKIALIRDQGVDPEVVPGVYANAAARAAAFQQETGAMQIHAYDAPTTVAGQGTLMREWEAQGLEADTVLIAVGGGGLIAGALAWLEGRRKLVAVEPAQAPTLHTTLREGPEAEITPSGIAANALGASKIGKISYDLAREFGVTPVLVSDAAIAEAQRLIWKGLRQLVEPAGAAAMAALTSGAYVPEPGEKLAVLLCGANPAPDPLG